MTQVATTQELEQFQRDLDYARHQLNEIESDLKQLEKNREAPPTYLKRKQMALKKEIISLEEALGGQG